MTCWIIFYTVVFSGITVALERGAKCITPNREEATCIPVRSCNAILDEILKGNEKAIEFAKRSDCGYDIQQLVCCGSLGNFNTSLLAEHLIQEKAPQPSISNGKLLPDTTVCGLERETTDKIIGGTLTVFGEHPWVAALEYKSKFNSKNQGVKCGGSLINTKYVLTAAHCILNVEFELTRVYLGEWDISTDPDCVEYKYLTECAEPVQKFNIEETIPHPYYSRKNNNNDIGLLRLEGEVTYTDYVRPICLPSADLEDPPVGTYMNVVGWGITENGTQSQKLLKVDVPVLSQGECMKKLEGKAISPNQLCAGGQQGKDSCKGDSGGPLMRAFQVKITDPFQWYLEGVVGWGVGCARLGYPAIYTRVSRYIFWIKNNIEE